jgi:hypothetical protein
MQSAMSKKSPVKRILKLVFSGFSIFFIGILFFIVVYDTLTGTNSSSTAEYCAKYGFLASSECWI